MSETAGITKRILVTVLLLLIGCAEDIPEPLTEEDILAMLPDGTETTDVDKITEQMPEEQVPEQEHIDVPIEPPERITGRDEAPMALIPAGEFLMGCEGEGCAAFQFPCDDAKPVHAVYLDAFYMDVYEVTNERYKKFVNATGRKSPKSWDDPRYNAPDQPVVEVTWYDAKAYAEWAGKRLPTEAEWEKAARGGLVGKRFPWGDGITHNDANCGGTGGRDKWADRAGPVGSFSPNGYRLHDMAGNVWEWCADWYDANYYVRSPRENPTGPTSGTVRVMRGGSFTNNGDILYTHFRSVNSGRPSHTSNNLGFRCAQDVTP